MERLVLVVLISIGSSIYAQKYLITRQIEIRDKFGELRNQPDLVEIPPSLCHDNGTTECPQLDGRRHSVCKCACERKDDEYRFYKSTFGFYNGTWKCEKNTVVRQHSGCLLSLELQILRDAFFVIPSKNTDNPAYRISDTSGSYIGIEQGANCSLKAEHSMYLTCDGEWKQLDTSVTNTFHIVHHHEYYIDLQVLSSASLPNPFPSGRIIRLAVTCSDRLWEPSQCVVMKIQGNLQCPVSSSTPTRQPAPQVVRSTSFPSMSSQSSSQPLVPNVNTPKKDSSTTFDNAFKIGVTLCGVAVLVVLIVLVVFIIRLRKKRFDSHKRKTSNATLIENKTYGEVLDKVQDPTRSMEGHSHPKGIYNSMDEPTMREEPTYSVPESITNNDDEQDEHLYHILEVPEPHGTPTPDVYEELRPDRDPPVYGTFDEPDKDTPEGPPRGYGNIVYDSVGDMREQSK